MKKFLLAAVLGLLSSLTSLADTVSLLPGKITGTVHLSSETIQSGSVYANATDGSGSASASFNGESYSLTVPAGKTWTLSFYLYPVTAGGGYTQLYVGPPEQVSVGAGETVPHDVSFASARLAANVQVSNGSLVAVNYLQAYRYTSAPDTSFSAYSNTSYLVVLPASGVTAYGTVAVQNTAGQNATLALPSTSVDVPAAGATVNWTVDAAFAAGTVLGNVSLQGPATPVATYLSLYGPNGSNSSTSLTANGSGNGSYQFDNLAEGNYSAYTTAYFNNYASYLQFYRYPQVVAGTVTQLDYVADLATVNATLQLGGFINAANLSGASLSGQNSDYST